MMKKITLLASVAAIALASCGVARAGMVEWLAQAQATSSNVTADDTGWTFDGTAGVDYDYGTLGGSVASVEYIFNLTDNSASVALGSVYGWGTERNTYKLEQWNNQGIFGITLEGHYDQTYPGVASTFGADTHVVFVTQGGHQELFINGVSQGNDDRAGGWWTTGGSGKLGSNSSGVGDVPLGTIYGVASYNGALTPQAVSDLYGAYIVPTVIPSWNDAIAAGSPLHWYRMNEPAGATVAIDHGSAGADGMYANGPLLGVSGEIDGAVQFDGDNDIVSLGEVALTGDWTVEAVINRQGIENAAHLLDRLDPGLSLRFEQWDTSGQLGYTRSGVEDYLFSPAVASPAIGEWAHITYVGRDGVGIDVYVDGVLKGSNPNYIELPRDTIGIANGFSINAVLDEMVIFDSALSAGAIALHAAAVPEPAGLALILIGTIGAVSCLRRRRAIG